jgi:hypothetical protein
MKTIAILLAVLALASALRVEGALVQQSVADLSTAVALLLSSCVHQSCKVKDASRGF